MMDLKDHMEWMSATLRRIARGLLVARQYEVYIVENDPNKTKEQRAQESEKVQKEWDESLEALKQIGEHSIYDPDGSLGFLHAFRSSRIPHQIVFRFDDPGVVGACVHEDRMEQGMSRAQVAELVGRDGCTADWVAKVERGEVSELEFDLFYRLVTAAQMGRDFSGFRTPAPPTGVPTGTGGAFILPLADSGGVSIEPGLTKVEIREKLRTMMDSRLDSMVEEVWNLSQESITEQLLQKTKAGDA
jgi:transcriptional regulator with XRE-family HTH domain